MVRRRRGRERAITLDRSGKRRLGEGDDDLDELVGRARDGPRRGPARKEQSERAEKGREYEGEAAQGGHGTHDAANPVPVGRTTWRLQSRPQADVAELVDAHGSGPCGSNPVEVRVLSSASSFQASILV